MLFQKMNYRFINSKQYLIKHSTNKSWELRILYRKKLSVILRPNAINVTEATGANFALNNERLKIIIKFSYKLFLANLTEK